MREFDEDLREREEDREWERCEEVFREERDPCGHSKMGSKSSKALDLLEEEDLVREEDLLPEEDLVRDGEDSHMKASS